MTRDEAKQLLGGYATGSLTESERKALFEAALDDQELFEELAGEQDLQAILALPGAKERLAAAVTTAGATTMSAPEEKKKRAWWLFALAGVASVGLLVWITTSKTDAPVQVASQTVETAEVPLPEPPVTSAALENAVREAREKLAEADKRLNADSFKNIPTAEDEKLARAASSAASKKEATARESKQRTQAKAPAAVPQAATAPPPPAQARGNGAVGGFAAGPGRSPALADSAAAEAQPQIAQNRAAAVKPAAPSRPDAPPVRAGSLTYVLTGRGSLKVTPAVSGSLEVTAADRHIIGWDPVVADSTVEMPVPSGVDSLTLRFAAPGQQPQVVQIPIRQ